MTVNGTNGHSSSLVLKAGVWAPIPTFFDDSEELGQWFPWSRLVPALCFTLNRLLPSCNLLITWIRS